MAGVVVSASKGVIAPLVDKISKLIEDKCSNLFGVSNDIVSLRYELQTINALLEKLEDTDETNPLLKDWKNKVRETAYDIEDCIDDFLGREGCGDHKAGFIHNVSHYLKTLVARLETAKQIKELKARLEEINERHKRYKFGDCISSSSSLAIIDPRLPSFYHEAANLMGIEGPREDVIELLTDTDQHLKVLSIVGIGGLGKTTLAMEVHRKIGEQFNINAFVSVSQRPDITSLLSGLLSKLGISSPTFQVKDVIDTIRAYLQNRRYFVVVDDLWDVTTWEIIRFAFPQNDIGSRVIATTRVEDVASWACSNRDKLIYKLKPLNDQYSRRLFCKRIFGSEEHCPPQFGQISAEILKKCGGLPLAVITISSLLANRPLRRNEWESTLNSIGMPGNGTNPTVDRMRQILGLSYKDLPRHLRACFLYLGIYPEDSIIRKNGLIRQWIAEGFIPLLPGRNSGDVARSYFNELINRSLIQPAQNTYGEIVSCRVHDIMLDLIISMCAEDNFIAVTYNLNEMAVQNEYKVRRLLLDLRVGAVGNAAIGSEKSATMLSQLRSLQLFRGSQSLLQLCKNIRVLILSYPETIWTGDNTAVDLTRIGQLLQLRYLKVDVKDDATILLPTEIQRLQHLTTLHLKNRNNNRIALPSNIVRLPCLSHLIVPWLTKIPDGICSIKSLCTINKLNISYFKNLDGLGELTSMRELKIYYFDAEGYPTAAERDALVTSLGKLCSLRCLSIPWNGYLLKDENDRLASLSSPPFPQIEKLDLSGWQMPTIPRWISADLGCLFFLCLNVTKISTDEVRALGDLPSLAYLSLIKSYDVPHQDGATVVFGTAGFPSLEVLKISWCDPSFVSHMRFEAGAMPNLQTLVVEYGMDRRGTAPVGIEHLQNLRDIYVSTFNGPTRDSFKEAIKAHKSCPALHTGVYGGR